MLEGHTAAPLLADLSGMRTVLEGRAGEEHAAAVAGLVRRGLGLDPVEADAIARRPLPAVPFKKPW